jgi:hypothetical protein
VDEVATVEDEVVLEAEEAVIVVDEEDFREAVVEVSFYIFAELNFRDWFSDRWALFPFPVSWWDEVCEQMWLTGG